MVLIAVVLSVLIGLSITSEISGPKRFEGLFMGIVKQPCLV
jgi:hypothetical protein